jgi:MerR family transcriptional regulator, light-induced transcriptional regulator
MSYSIKDIENLTGIKAATLRIWERRYSFMIPNRSDTNIRFYTDDQARQLLNVSILMENGHKISKISKMSSEEFDCELQNVINKIDYSQNHLNKNLDIALFEYDEFALNSILNNFLVENGFFALMEKLVYPYLNKVGLLWSKSDITPSNEHFLSNIIRQKIISEIDKIVVRSDYHKTVALFLPDGEQHEISLLYSNFIFKYLGWKTYYLGLNVPYDSLDDFTKSKKPDYVFTIPTNYKFLTKKYIDVLNSCGCKKVIVANEQVELSDEQFKDLYVKVSSPVDLRKYVVANS